MTVEWRPTDNSAAVSKGEYTEYHIELGNRIACQFTLPDKSQIHPEGEVARCFRATNGKTLYGVKFVDLPSTNRSAIERYIAANNHLGIKQKPYRPLERVYSCSPVL